MGRAKVRKCKRTECFANCAGKWANNCSVLTELYDDDNKCPFCKPRKEVKKKAFSRL